MNVIDRIVEQNDALWDFLTASDDLNRTEKMELLRRAFPGSRALAEDNRVDDEEVRRG